MTQVAIYARVSTRDQDPSLQLETLRRHAEQRGFEIFREYVDHGISGAQVKRPQLDRLMADAWAGKFKAVLVWKFDRFARSLPHLLQAIEEFSKLGIDFISLTEQFDTSAPIGRAMFAVVGAMAQLERDLIRERVIAGIERAKAKGVRLGRPPVFISAQQWSQIQELRRLGVGWRTISKRLGIAKGTLFRRARPDKTYALLTEKKSAEMEPRRFGREKEFERKGFLKFKMNVAQSPDFGPPRVTEVPKKLNRPEVET